MKQDDLCEGSPNCISPFAGSRTNRCQGLWGSHGPWDPNGAFYGS